MPKYDELLTEILEYYESMNEAKRQCDIIIAQKETEAKDALAMRPADYLPGQTWEIISRALIRDDPDFKVWSGKYGFRRERMLALLALHADMQRTLMIKRFDQMLDMVSGKVKST